MKAFNIPPKLRSYGPALFGFCKKGMADKAYEVDAHMAASGVMPEEAELSALLKLSADVNRADKVYRMLHRLRATVRQVTELTFGIIEDWFKSEDASRIGEEKWDESKVREGVVKGGGGWHGQGWLGSGQWRVVRTFLPLATSSKKWRQMKIWFLLTEQTIGYHFIRVETTCPKLIRLENTWSFTVVYPSNYGRH